MPYPMKKENQKTMKKEITLEMVEYWLGWCEDEGAKTLREIANSHKEDNPWTPNILYNDILETWEGRSVECYE